MKSSFQLISDTADLEKEIDQESLLQPTETTDTQNEECLFCNYKAKRVASKLQYLRRGSEEIKEKILQYSLLDGDENLSNKLKSSNTIFYHQVCYTIYVKKFATNPGEQRKDSDWHKMRELHKSAFQELSEFIKSEILENERILLLNALHVQYMATLFELNENKEDTFMSFTTTHLKEKILKDFGDSIVVKYSNSLHKSIVHKKNIDVNKLIDNAVLNQMVQNDKFRDVAFEIRKSIMSIEKKPLPDNLTPEDLITGECKIPSKLDTFMTHLIKGPNKRRNESDEDSVRMDSICNDIIYTIHRGRVKPAKQIKLAMTVKSMANSKIIIQLLNKLGHAVSYTTAEELETEMTYTAYNKNDVIPSSINIKNTCSTHVAFDNYDRFVETLDGKDTLHDTVGIIYQFIDESLQQDSEDDELNTNSEEMVIACSSTSTTSTIVSKKRRRKRFDEIPMEITAYSKKPKAITTLLPLNNIKLNTTTKEDATVRDLVWMMCLSLVPDMTPMWTGFISQTNIDNSSVQTVDYLPQINMSPTSYAVVHETMTLSDNIRKECNQNYIIVTYDLQIAKMAMQVQIEESPKFNNLFINLGGFHVQLSFFKAIGKYVSCSGIENILIESGVIAAGSINGFISGKHYNRCKRIHTILSGALQSLHFEKFLETKQFDNEVMDNIRQDVLPLLIQQTDPSVPVTLSSLLEEVITEYRAYMECTMSGEHGKTAQYYILYVNFMNIYFRFSRSIRTSDILLFVESLYEMADLFFTFNHQNYSRWILKYISNLLEVADTNQQILTDFKKGVFGIKRTNISMSRSPVDLTLEQTVNANAGNTLTGLTHMTSSIGARQRWALSHTMRAKIVTAMLEDVQINKKDDVNSDLKKCHFQKDVNCLKELIETIKKCFNPFNESIEHNELFNISTGRSAKEETANFLLNVQKIGEQKKLEFINECNEDPNRFEKSIKKNKILNFDAEAAVKQFKNQGKIVHLKMERDIFGRLLALSLENQINIEICLSFPLAPLPPALAQYNGDMFKTTKSKLAEALKENITTTGCPTNINEEIYIIDGFHLLRTMGTIPQSYGKISDYILRKICNTTAKEIHLIFDIYKSPSIKDAERIKRGLQNIPYQISEVQCRDTNFMKSLNNIGFKEAFISFLGRHWENEYHTAVIGNKKVFLTIGNSCFSYIVEGRSITKIEETNFQCSHEEADTRIIYHLHKVCVDRKILIRASDTDILVILLGNMHVLPAQQIWMTAGDKQEAIDCTNLFKNLGPELCKALPFLHAYTGCDYNPAFKGKGKMKPFKILKNNKEYQKIFPQLLTPDDVHDDQKMSIVQKFTNEIYGIKNDDVNAGRVLLFNKKYNRQTMQGPLFKKTHSFDSENIPPCWKSLEKQILRAIYINSMWLTATENNCEKLNPEDCGWLLSPEYGYQLHWFEGDPTPLNAEDIILSQKSSEESEFSSPEDIVECYYSSDDDTEN